MLKRLLGLLGWLGVVLVFAGGRDLATSGRNGRWWYGLAIAGLVCVAALRPQPVARNRAATSPGGRRATARSPPRASSSCWASSRRINYLAERHNKRWDLTAASQYTLSDQTKKVLQGLTKPVQGHGLRAHRRLRALPRRGSTSISTVTKQLQVEYIDPEKRPSLAERLKENALGTIVLEYDGRVQRVTSDAEQDLTNGLIKVVQGQQPKVYFVQGHGERDIAGSDGAGYGGIAERAEGRTTSSPSRSSCCSRTIPADAVGRGRSPDRSRICCEPEIDKLKAYLAKGGKLLVLIDPPQNAGRAAADQPDRAAEGLVGRGRQQRRPRSDEPVARRPGRRAGRGAVSVSPDHEHVPAADGLSLRAVGQAGRGRAADGRTATSFVMSGRNSWAESDLKPLTTKGEAAARVRQGRRAGPDLAGRRGRRRRSKARTPPPPADGQDAERRTSPRRASSSSATRTSPPTPSPGSAATATCS